MESCRKELIFQQVSAQFNVSVLKKKYYCPGISNFTLQDKLFSYHGENIEIFFRVDHIVVRHSFNKRNHCVSPHFTFDGEMCSVSP